MMPSKHGELQMTRKRLDNGFTIMELLVAMAIVSIVMIAVVSAYQLQVSSKNTQDSLTDMNQAIRAALEIMNIEIRMAGLDVRNTAGAGILAATNNQFDFTMDIGGGASFEPDGDLDDPNERITYGLNGGNLTRSTNGGPNQPLAENVDALDFVYLDEDGNVTGTLADIRTVQVAVVIRTGQAGGFMKSYTDTQVYRNLQNQVIFGPAGDGFRRMVLRHNINCYNFW